MTPPLPDSTASAAPTRHLSATNGREPRDAHHPYRDRSDDDLVTLVRDGDGAAYGELWSRHSGIGLAIARRYFDVADPDDLVAESFARILATIKRGGGPRAGFRPYLITTIGNVARRWATRSKEGASDELDLLVDPSTVADPVVASTDREFALEAFKSLPERWQAVLWFSAVEGMGPSEIAGHLGMTPNATAVLAHRARAGLRTAWVQAHLNDDTLPAECRWTAGRLGRRATGSLNRREHDQVKAHLATCLGCRSRARELDQVSSRLAVWLVPALLGLGIPLLDDGAPAVAASATTPLSSAPLAPAPLAPAPLAPAAAIAPAWITAALGIGAAATLVTALLLGSPVPVSTVSTADAPARAHELVVDDPSAAPTVAAPADAVPSQAAPAADPQSEPEPAPDPAPSVVQQRDPAVVPAPSAPVITTTIDPFALTPPTIAGTGQPGARLVVTDELGTTLADVAVDAAGAWSTGTLIALSPAAASVEVSQVDAQGRLSPSVTVPLSARPLSSGVVTPLAPDWHLTLNQYTPLTLTVQGWPGATVAIEHANTSSPEEPRFPSSVVLDASGLASVTIPTPWPGTHTVTVRYVDTGREGPATSSFFIWVPWYPD